MYQAHHCVYRMSRPGGHTEAPSHLEPGVRDSSGPMSPLLRALLALVAIASSVYGTSNVSSIMIAHPRGARRRERALGAVMLPCACWTRHHLSDDNSIETNQVCNHPPVLACDPRRG
jgi:hypothetical protein